MTFSELKARFPHASASFIKSNCDLGGAQSAKPKPAIRDVAHSALPREESHAESVRCRVTVVAYRARLCDPDNLCPKYFVDCLRYAQIIRNDTQADIELLVRQRKVAKINLERTELIIERLEP